MNKLQDELNLLCMYPLSMMLSGFRFEQVQEELQVEVVELSETEHKEGRLSRGRGRFDASTTQASGKQASVSGPFTSPSACISIHKDDNFFAEFIMMKLKGRTQKTI